MNRVYTLIKVYLRIFIFSFFIMIWFDESLTVIAVTAAILLLVILLPAYLITTIGADAIHRNDARYREYRRNGGHPFWDNL